MKLEERSGIIYRRWQAVSPEAVLLLVHGLGAHSERWEFLADFFVKQNISSYAIELKGFGETKTLKGHIDSFNIYSEDIRVLHNIIQKENYGKKVFLIGESMGALLVFLEAVNNFENFSGLVCISPAFVSKLELTMIEYLKIFSSFIYNPKRKFNIPFDSSMLTRDIDYKNKMDEDPRELRFATSKLLVSILLSAARANILKNRITIPVLFLVAGQDKIVKAEASEGIFNSMKVKDKTIIFYPNMYHALTIDLGREKVFTDILHWIKKTS